MIVISIQALSAGAPGPDGVLYVAGVNKDGGALQSLLRRFPSFGMSSSRGRFGFRVFTLRADVYLGPKAGK